VVEGTVVDVWQRKDGELYWESGPKAFTKEQAVSYFRLDDDLEEIRRGIDDPKVDAAFAEYPGLRLLRQEPWETLVSFVISQVSNVPRISKTVDTLSLHYGEKLGDGISNSFPVPDRLAQADEGALRLLGLGYRAPHICTISNAIADGELFLEPLKFMPYEEALKELTKLPGIGPKVADCCLLFSLDHLEAFPVDRWVIRAVEEWYGLRQGMSQVAIGGWAREHFGPFAGYAGQYLFHARREGGPECPSPDAPDIGDPMAPEADMTVSDLDS
jgi:N-glycosylase/DNA lyase